MERNLREEVAYLLATHSSDRTWRSELRSQLPQGQVVKATGDRRPNDVSVALKKALHAFEGNGWVEREEEGAVLIVDRGSLWLFAQGEATE